MDLLYPNFRKHSSYYIQKLEKPQGHRKIFRKDYGVSQEEKEKILTIFDLPSMGAAEYEYEKFSDAYNEFKLNNKDYVARKINFLNKDYFIIAHKDNKYFYTDIHFAAEGCQKERIRIVDEDINPGYIVYDTYSDTKSWMFFSDKELFQKVCTYFSIDKTIIVKKKKLTTFENFVKSIENLNSNNYLNFFKKNRIKKIDNSILSKWSTLDFLYFYNRKIFNIVLKDKSLFSFKNKGSNLFNNYYSGIKLETYLYNCKSIEDLAHYEDLLPDISISGNLLDHILYLCYDDKVIPSFVEDSIICYFNNNKKINVSILRRIVYLESKNIYKIISIDEIKRIISSLNHFDEDYNNKLVKPLVKFIFTLDELSINEFKKCITKDYIQDKKIKNRGNPKRINKFYDSVEKLINIEENKLNFKKNLS